MKIFTLLSFLIISLQAYGAVNATCCGDNGGTVCCGSNGSTYDAWCKGGTNNGQGIQPVPTSCSSCAAIAPGGVGATSPIRNTLTPMKKIAK